MIKIRPKTQIVSLVKGVVADFVKGNEKFDKLQIYHVKYVGTYKLSYEDIIILKKVRELKRRVNKILSQLSDKL